MEVQENYLRGGMVDFFEADPSINRKAAAMTSAWREVCELVQTHSLTHTCITHTHNRKTLCSNTEIHHLIICPFSDRSHLVLDTFSFINFSLKTAFLLV